MAANGDIPIPTVSALRLRWLTLRHAWPVRWAHHPLCQRHAHETWRIGELHLCKGCVSLAVGLAIGSLLVLGMGGAWCAYALPILGPLTFAPSWPPLYQRLPRAIRNWLRASAGLFVACSAWTVGQWPQLAWPLLPLIALLWWWFQRARKPVIARRCDGCPELGGDGVCSGYARQAQSARAIEAAIEARIEAQLSGGLSSADRVA